MIDELKAHEPDEYSRVLDSFLQIREYLCTYGCLNADNENKICELEKITDIIHAVNRATYLRDFELAYGIREV